MMLFQTKHSSCYFLHYILIEDIFTNSATCVSKNHLEHFTIEWITVSFRIYCLYLLRLVPILSLVPVLVPKKVICSSRPNTLTHRSIYGELIRYLWKYLKFMFNYLTLCEREVSPFETFCFHTLVKWAKYLGTLLNWMKQRNFI